MTKTLKWIIALISILLILFGIFYMLLNGNPISKFLVNRNAEKYLKENFQNTDYYVCAVNFNFKTGSYYAQIMSPSSGDTYFTLYSGANGKITYDSYEDAVVNKWNTAQRINSDYRDAVDVVLGGEDFPYNHDIGFGDIEFAESDALADGAVPHYAIKTEGLELDGVYDINELGKKAGHLTVYVADEDVSYERLSEILLGIKALMDEGNVSFYVIDCVLEYPKAEDESLWRDDRVEVMSFLYDDIYEEGLVSRVKESDEKAKAYYAELDAEKLYFE